uniref:Uncharacterized protein n=1 Tax=Urocitellus parryii TaxID=9999 RepID=A0A8D2IBB4_UROPR
IPSPEQPSFVEEGQSQICQEATSNGRGIEPNTTAITNSPCLKEKKKKF